MKIHTILAVLVMGCTSVLAQIPQLEPKVGLKPDLDSEFIEKTNKLREEVLALIRNKEPIENYTEEQRQLLNDDELLEVGPFGTGPLGCSWYCATGPNDFQASSTLKPSGVSDYLAKNIHDFDLQTAWVEGKPDYGIGEELQISFNFQPNLQLTTMIIYNGYCKSEKHWKQNSRVKTLALYANEDFLGYLNLKDTYKSQRFEIGTLVGDTNNDLILTLRIIEVYPGDKFMDTAISEINFSGEGDH